MMTGAGAPRATGIMLAAILGLALLSACGQSVPALPPLASEDVVLAFGDSLTYGTGAERQESYPAVLSELIGREVINAGQPAELSEAGLERLPALLDRYQPALLLLCHGGNDLLRRKPTGQAEQNLRQMVFLARARGIPVVLVGVPSPGLWLSSADYYKKIATDLGLPYEGEVLPEILGKNGLKSDMVHPNSDGYRLLAESIAELLRKAGAV